MNINMLDSIRKIHMLESGRVVGSTYRWKCGYAMRGRIPKRPFTARIFYNSGKVENVIQQ